MKAFGKGCWIFLFVLFVCGSVSALTIGVPGDYPTIATAISHAENGDTVLVADGVYTGYGNRNIFFDGKAITVISENGPENCIIDCGATVSDNHRAFNFVNGETDASVLSGFTIRNGFSGPHGPFGSHGGAIACDAASPVIENCVFENNHAYFSGGAIESYDGNITIRNCSFINNTVDFLAGAVYIHDQGSIRGCTFIGNEAMGRGSLSGHGGAVHASYDAIEIIISGCVFQGNVAEYGGAIGSSSGNIRIYQNQFIDNVAHYGGAITVGDDQVIVGGSEADGNTFTGNRAAIGAELFCGRSGTTVNAQYNTFSGRSESEYWFYSTDGFDFTGSVFGPELVSQDVFVSPEGDDQNDGLSWETPFKTIHYAMSRILATVHDPINVYLAPGVYSPSTTGELFPFPAQSWTIVQGAGPDQTILDAEYSDLGMLIYQKSLKISGLTITHGVSNVGGILMRQSSPLIENCVVVACEGYEIGGIQCYSQSSPYIRNCRIIENSGTYAGGIRIENESSPHIAYCEISGNTSSYSAGGIGASYSCEPVIVGCRISDNHAENYGGGFYFYKAVPLLFNCLIEGNSAEIGGGMLASNSSARLQNVTMVNNSADIGGGIEGHYSVGITVTDSIIRNNSIDQILGDSLSVTYSNIQDGYPGEGNIDLDPLFTAGPDGYYYLSHLAAGQPVDSPCVDSGSDLAETICAEVPDDIMCVDETWTRRDEIFDVGQVDMGCHYPLGGESTGCINDGDITLDGLVTSSDAQQAFMIALGLYVPTFTEACAADCNHDDTVTAEDGQMIFLKAMGMGECG